MLNVNFISMMNMKYILVLPVLALTSIHRIIVANEMNDFC